jgi:hypothetical protein
VGNYFKSSAAYIESCFPAMKLKFSLTVSFKSLSTFCMLPQIENYFMKKINRDDVNFDMNVYFIKKYIYFDMTHIISIFFLFCSGYCVSTQVSQSQCKGL